MSLMVNPAEVTCFDPLMATSGTFPEVVGPPSPPWEDEDILDSLQDIDVMKQSSIMDDFLSSSPTSMLDQATDDAIESFFLEANEVIVGGDFESSNLQSVQNDAKEQTVVWKQVMVTVDDQNNLVENTKERNIVGYCSVCKLVFSSESQLAEHRLAYAKKIACCQCCKKFSTMSKLRVHHRKHSKEKPFQCQACGKYYTHRQSLARHQLLYCKPLKLKCLESYKKEKTGDLKNITPSISENKCDKMMVKRAESKCRICDMQFFDKDSLDSHNQYFLNHRECCRCHKVLGNKSKLITHHRSHTKELPYECHLCNKRFAENSTLRKHIATHGERHFRCTVCSKAFVRKDYLVKHEVLHKQTYKCSQCHFICHTKQDIESHVATSHN